MAGLLDMFPSDLNDPRAQFNLALAAGLLGGRGNFAQTFGQALPMALGTYNQAQESAQQRAARQLQIDQAKRKQEQEKKDRELMMRFATAQYPLGATAMRPETMQPLPFDPLAVLREGGSPEVAQTLAALRAPKAPIKVGTEDTLLDPQTFKPVYQGAGKQSDFERTLGKIFPPGSPQYQQAMQDWIRKQSTHQPAVQVNYGTPMPAINPKTGKVELMRPDNRGGMTFTGIEPAPQQRDNKVPAEIQRMNIAASAMDDLLNEYEAMVKKFNPRDPLVQANPTVRADMQSLMKNLQLQFKELQALGALTGPDVAIMEAAITDPFSFKGAFYGKDGLLSQVQRARQLIGVRRKAVEAETGRAQRQANPSAVAPDQGNPSVEELLRLYGSAR